MLTAASAFALFLMLAIASMVYYAAKRFELPYTVLLTLVGVVLVPISSIDYFGFLREFQLTPELLFFIFLPTLLFESAYNINIRRVVEEFKPIMLLAIVGYLISSLLIGGGLFLVLGALGFSIPFVVTFLFGALISATDPVAVLALFKEYGAPPRLSLLFEGESLMNDATALALFLIVLGLIGSGISGVTVILGFLTFITMLTGGILLGLLVGVIFVQLIGLFRDNEIVGITLMIVLAHSTFLIAELSNTALQYTEFSFIQLSPIIATTVASLLMGNYGRFKITPNAEEFIAKFWSQFAFMANSIVFILVGFLFASIPQGAETLLIPTVATIVVVALARAISVYVTITPYNLLSGLAQKIPMSWQHLLAWGSLRGALAVMLVLLIPSDVTVSGWTLALSVKEFLLILTVGCIFATLFLKAPTIGPIIRRLKIDNLSTVEEVASQEARAIIHGTTILKIQAFAEKKYIPKDIATKLVEEHKQLFKKALAQCCDSTDPKSQELAERVLRLYLIGLEKEVLKELAVFNEITERIFKRINGKLVLQAEEIEEGNLTPNIARVRDERDFFENIAEGIRGVITRPDAMKKIREEYLFFRAQKILARKVLKELGRLRKEFPEPVFNESMLQRSEELYEQYERRAAEQMEEERQKQPDEIEDLDEALALRSVYRIEERYLKRLYQRQTLSQKLFINMHDEYEREVTTRQFKI